MVFINNLKLKPVPVYFGHPSTFWRDRQRMLTKAVVDVEKVKKLGDVVDYDSVHLQKAIINRTSIKLQKIIDQEDYLLKIRRDKLKQMLEREEEYYIQELVTKQETEECGVCREREEKKVAYEEDIEKQKIRECQKALEREKIAKGMQCTRTDEYRLREMQKMQIEEKRQIKLDLEHKDKLWHQVLVSNVKRKEQMERTEQERRRLDMLERRRLYDEQIALAVKNKNDVLESEKEKERKKLESIRKKMEQDYLEEIRKKKEKQQLNRKNYIEGHEINLIKLENEKQRESKLDNETLRIAFDEMRHERNRQTMTMNKLQTEKQIFVQNSNLEKKIAEELERESEIENKKWIKIQQNLSDEQFRNTEMEKRMHKEKMTKDYRKYLEEKRRKTENERIEREATMDRVRQSAIRELQRQLGNANEEYRKQMDYRNSLQNQIENNQRVTYEEMTEIENKLRPFTEKMESFKEAMATKVDTSPGRLSTNPMHPFARLQQASQIKHNGAHLPLLRI